MDFRLKDPNSHHRHCLLFTPRMIYFPLGRLEMQVPSSLETELLWQLVLNTNGSDLARAGKTGLGPLHSAEDVEGALEEWFKCFVQA